MAYQEEENKVSVFNAGVAQAIRIDEQQKILNAVRFVPLVFQPMYGDYGYSVRISALHNLAYEAWGKCKDVEKQLVEKFEKLIKLQLELHPIVEQIVNDDGESKTMIYYENYETLNHILNIYEKNVKMILDAHNFNSPNRQYQGL